MTEEVLKLKESINNSNIKELRFGLEPQKKFTEEEKLLDYEMLKRKFFMINEMVGIKELCSILGLTESAVKQACQQERLLNTKKIGKNWMVLNQILILLYYYYLYYLLILKLLRSYTNFLYNT